MSLARALTKRLRAPDNSSAYLPVPGRAVSTRKYDRPINRAQISLPLELLSTTNVLAFEAPDIPGLKSALSDSSDNSFDDSDSSPGLSSSSSISTPDTLSREPSPVTVEPNHLSTYFEIPGRAKSEIESSRQSKDSSDSDAPAIPKRALSHTKKSHQISAVKRSSSKVRSPPSSISQPPTARSSLDLFSAKPEANHPFGAELAQVNELAEEFGAKNITIWDEEEQYLMEHGLQKYGAEDYAMEIESLFGGVFDDRPFPLSAGWI